jgi:type IV secretory pathway TraG/TraD family ATPase VirD4
MDKREVLLVNLAKGKLGEDASHLLGGLLMTSIGLAAFSRADQIENHRVPHHLYADEFQNFTTLSLVNMASELRKYALSITLANQYLAQLDPEIRSAILGNVGTLISFRVGAEDTRLLTQHFSPHLSSTDILNLPNRNFYLKMMIDGQPSQPFSASTLPSAITQE